jgi:hypothetical protein
MIMMLKFIVAVALMFNSALLLAQSSKQVKWSFTATKKGDFYEVRCKATIGTDYHLYAQNAGNGVGKPTAFKFNKNPLLTLQGGVIEKGKLITAKESLGKKMVSVRYYANTVEFIQLVKAKTTTNISGNVSYMVCNASSCLPPSATSFDIALQ